MKLQNKTIIVTGANGIIGAEVCLQAIKEGANVAALDVVGNTLVEVANTLTEDQKKNFFFVKCDLTQKVQVEEARDQILNRWGKIDGLHNNAAWKGYDLKKFFSPFEKYEFQVWKDILSVNLDSVMIVDQIMGGHMAHHEVKGSIVHTASIYGIVGPDNRIYEGSDYMGGPINTPAVYSASKGAVIALSNYLATYWGPKGIRVNCITPGGVESGQNETFIANYSKKVPLGRMAKAYEIADAVIFLLSDGSSYMNGHNLVIDGGFTTW